MTIIYMDSNDLHRLFPGMQNWFNIEKLMSKIHLTNSIKNKNYSALWQEAAAGDVTLDSEGH